MAQWRTPRQAPGAPNRPTADAHLAALLASPREAPLAVYSSRVVIEAPEDWGHDVVAATVVVEGGRVAAVLPGRRAAAPAVGVDRSSCSGPRRRRRRRVVGPARRRGLRRHGRRRRLRRLRGRVAGDGPRATDCDYASCGPLGSSLATASLTDFGRGATTTRDAWRAGATAGVVVCDCVRLSEEERDLASPFCRHEPEARLRAPSPLARLPLCAVDQDHGRARAPSVERHAAKTPHDGPWVGALLEAELRSYAFVSSPKTDSQSSSPGEGKRGLDFSGAAASPPKRPRGRGAFEEPSSALRGRRPAEARPASPRLSRLRPGPVAVYKDADALTRRAIRRDYSLLTRAHPSEAQARGLRADDVRPGATLYKVRPPIRHTGHGRALWGALDDGALDCVHSGFDPVAPHLKCAFRGDFARASPGTCAFANADVLVALWARLAERGVAGKDALGRVASWLARNPADALRLAGKGRIAPGRDADLLLFDADGAHEAPRGRNGPGIYDAGPKRGNVAAVVVRGRVVFARGRRRDAKVGQRLG
ncbi:hydrolase [Aureococcus anophagefferens]|nr:hydrolase [Aureococcus anophagefferens]